MSTIRKNDRRVIQAMAEAAHIPPGGFTVEVDHGFYILNHPDSQKWDKQRRDAVVQAAKSVLPPGAKASLM